MRKIVATIYVTVFALLMVGCGADQAMKKGDKYMAIGEFYDAADQYKKDSMMRPTNTRKPTHRHPTRRKTHADNGPNDWPNAIAD